MDFHGMKRKELQALCKKHGVAANLTNREMADRLGSIFKGNEDPVSSEELRSNTEEICSEEKGNSVKKQTKKVRFSPDNQTFEYEASVYQQPRRRSRRQTLSSNPAQVLENAVSEDIKKSEGCQSRVTRSRVQNAVEEEIHMLSLLPVGRKRGRGVKRIKDAEEVANIGDSEGLELGQKEDANNGHDKVTGGLSRRQLRSRKNVARKDSKKIRNDKGSDEVHFLDETSDGKNGQKQSVRNARKGDQGVAFNSDVEKVEVVSRVTRQSRAQSKDVTSMVKNEVKIVEVRDGNETEKPLRRTKRNSEKDCAKSAASDGQVTKAQEQSKREITLVEPPECLRRHSSRQKSVASQSGKKGNKEEFPKEETRKQSRTTELEAILEDSSEVQTDKYAATSQQLAPLRRSRRKTMIITAPAVELANKEDIGEVEHLGAPLLGKGVTGELDAIVEDGSEVDRVNYAVTSQHKAPLRRGRRKTVILTAPAVELADKEDVGRMEQFRAPLLGKGVTEELLQKSSRNSSRYSLSGTSKEDQIAVAESDQGVKQQVLEPISEVEETSAREHHPMEQKPQRRSRRITSKSASIAPPNSTAKGVKSKGRSKPRMEIVEEETAPAEILPSPEELPAGKDVQFVVSECAGNKNNLDLDVRKQVVKSGDACSNKRRKELRRNPGAKKQCGFVETSPRFLNMEEDKDSAGNMNETHTASPVKLVGSSKDQEMKKSGHKSPVVYEKESNLLEDDVEKTVNCGKFETQVNCMSSQTVHKTCLLDDANCSDLKHLKCVSKGSQGADSSLITFPAESHGNEVSDQEMKEDIDLMDVHSSHESLVVYKEDRALVESEVQVDAADSEMNHNSSTRFSNLRGAVTDYNGVKSRLVEFESNVINKDELTSRDNGHSLADQRDLTGATSTFLHLEKELGTELPGGENTDFASDNTTATIRRTPFGETQIIVELKDTYVTAAEEMTANDVSHREGIPHIECSVEAAEIQESSSQSHSATTETDAQKIVEFPQSSYNNTVAPGNQFEDMRRAEIADAAGRGMFDQERIEDPNPGNEFCIHEPVLIYEEKTGLVKKAKEIRIRDGYFESESSPPSNRAGAVDDSNLVESRMVGSEMRGRKAVCSEIASVADVFSSASQGSHAGKTSSPMEPKKVLEMQEPSGNTNSINYNIDAEGISTPVVEDQIKGKLKNANMTIADSVEEIIFSDLLNELGENIGFKRGSEIPLKTSEKVIATMFSNGERTVLTESSEKAEKQEYSTAMDVVAAISGTLNTTEMKCRSSSDTATCGTSVGLAPQSQDETSNELKLEKALDLEESSRTENVANYTSDKIEVKEDINLSPEDQSSMHLEDILESDKMDVKEVISPAQEDQSSMYLEDTNMTAAGPGPVQELVVIWESDKMEVKEGTNLAPDDQSSVHLEDTNMTAAGPVQELVIRESDKMEVKEDINLAPEDQSSLQLEDTNITAAEPALEVVYRESDTIEVKEDRSLALEDQNSMHLEEFNITAAEPAQELVFRESDKIEVKEDTSLALEDQNSMHLEDINITAAEPVQEVAFRDQMNNVTGSGGTKESEVSLKKAEETRTDDSSGIGTVQTESSVETNEMSEATCQKTVMAMQWNLSSHDKYLISPLRPQVGSKDVQGTNYRVEIDVSNAGCAVPGQLHNEENVKTVENEDTINTGNFVSGKKITDQSSEGKYRADDIYHPLLESIDSQCAKDEKLDISDGSFNNVSGETKEKHTCEVLDEGTDPVSPEEKGNDILESASHGICNEKLYDNSCLHAINDMQEKLEAVCMDTRNEIQANAFPQLAIMQLDYGSQTLNQGAEIEVNARAFSTATQALPLEELTAPITSESFSMNPFDHVLVDGETNASGERGVGHPFINGYAATMDIDGISMSGETNVQEDNITEKIATSPLKVELIDYTSGNVDAELYDHNMSVTDPIFQDTFGVPTTEYPEEIANAPVAIEAENYGDLDDQGGEVGLEHDHSSPFEVDGLTSTVGLTVHNISVVGPLESTLNSSYPLSGTKVDDPDINDTDATALTIDQARVEDGEKATFTIEKVGVEDGETVTFTIEEAWVKDGKKANVSHQRSLGEEEDASSSADTPCSKLEISIEKEHPQAMDDISDVAGTEISTECKVTREERDGCQTNSGCFNDVTDGIFGEESMIGLEETVGAKSDDCEVSMKTGADLDGIDNSDVNQSPCMDERKNCSLEIEEPNVHFPETEDGDSREIESCSELNIVSSMKSKMVVDCASDERQHLENPHESNIFTNMEMRLFFGVEDEVKNSDAKADDSNNFALDMAITECNSSGIKEGDYIAISEDTEAMELRNDHSGLDAVMSDKSPLLKTSEIGKGEDGENTAAFRTELNLLKATAEKERSNSVPVKQLISSIMRSKSKPGLIQRTPKLPKFHDMKENESSSKREQIGNRTTPKISSKLRPPLQRI
ncbi:hypothetical protein V6N13_120757 [Hibiscus sabdariffa]|uniref:SAP domain-containing protein n=1 Tax=Hibiscus sabdariffa TaxID=183260 RepID=A0ABR2E571_9ROSI